MKSALKHYGKVQKQIEYQVKQNYTNCVKHIIIPAETQRKKYSNLLFCKILNIGITIIRFKQSRDANLNLKNSSMRVTYIVHCPVSVSTTKYSLSPQFIISDLQLLDQLKLQAALNGPSALCVQFGGTSLRRTAPEPPNRIFEGLIVLENPRVVGTHLRSGENCKVSQ